MSQTTTIDNVFFVFCLFCKTVNEDEHDWPEGEIDFSKITPEKVRAIVDKSKPYYPVFKGSDNPYRDGYITEPPRKPRASYIFFQCALRTYYLRYYPNTIQSELMSILGEKWNALSDTEKAPFLQIAADEAKEYEREKLLKEKGQKPNEVWQPIRRCEQVLKRLEKDSFAEIFMEPVDVEDFPDYEDYIDSPMDLGTIRTKLETKKYQAPEQFARDVRKVSKGSLWLPFYFFHCSFSLSAWSF
jgi:hypothetical protein